MSAIVSLNGISLGSVDSVSGAGVSDTVQLLCAGSLTVFAIESVIGSSGTDVISIGSAPNSGPLYVAGIETLLGSAGADVVSLLNAGNIAIRDVETVFGSAGIDTVKMLCSGTLTVAGIESIVGSNDNDHVNVFSVGETGNTLYVKGVESLSWYGQGGTLSIDNVMQTVLGSGYNETLQLRNTGSVQISAIDTVIGSGGSNALILLDNTTVTISHVETIQGSSGTDTLNVLGGGQLSVTGIENIYASGNSVDTVTLQTASTLQVGGVESIVGSAGQDVISLFSTGDVSGTTYLTGIEKVSASYMQYGGTISIDAVTKEVNGGQYWQDTLVMRSANAVSTALIESVIGSSGNDSITMKDQTTITLTNVESVNGSTGTDTIINLSNNSLTVRDVENVNLHNGGSVYATGLQSITGSGGSVDNVHLMTASTLTIAGIETLIGSAGNDTVSLYSVGDVANTTYLSGIETVSTSYLLYGGTISVDGATQTVNGGLWQDNLVLRSAHSVNIAQIDNVTGATGTDTLLLQDHTTVTVHNIESIIGSNGADSIIKDSSNTIYLNNIETLTQHCGGAVLATGIESLIGSGGFVDKLTLLTSSNILTSGVESIIGSAGQDSVSLYAAGDVGNTTYLSGVETISASYLLYGGTISIDAVTQSVTGGAWNDTLLMRNASTVQVALIDTIVGSTGNDSVQMLDTTTINVSAVENVLGSAGTDTVYLHGGHLSVSNVETIIGVGGFTDTLTLLTSGTVAVAGIESIIGSRGADTVNLSSTGDAGSGTFISGVETVNVTAYGAQLHVGSGVHSVHDINYQNSTVTLTTGLAVDLASVASVLGSSGNDKITLLDSHSTVLSGVESVIGSLGTDSLYVVGGGVVSVRDVEYVEGRGGSNDILKLLSAGTMTVTSVESVIGSSGNDNLTVLYGGDIDGSVFVSGVETVNNMYAYPLVLGAGVSTVNGGIYTDRLTLTTGLSINISAIDSITGSSGVDKVTMLDNTTLTVANVESVTGSSGFDTLYQTTDGSLFLRNVENIALYGGGDVSAYGATTVIGYGNHGNVLHLQNASTLSVNGIETVIGSSASDKLTVIGNGETTSNIFVDHVESIEATGYGIQLVLGSDTTSVSDFGYHSTIVTLTTATALNVTGIASVIGSAGIDTLTMKTAQTMTVFNIESVIGSSGTDTLYQVGGGSLSVRGIETVYGSGGGTDSLQLLSSSNVEISHIESVNGSSGNDSVAIYYGGEADNSIYIANVETVTNYYAAPIILGQGVNSVVGSGYADRISLTTGSSLDLFAVDSVSGSAGIDKLFMHDHTTMTVDGVESVVGTSGLDNIYKSGTTSIYVRDIENLTVYSGGAIQAYGVQTVSAYGNNIDTLTLLTASNVTVYGIESVIGSSRTDSLSIIGNGDASGSVYVSDVESIQVTGYATQLLLGRGVHTVSDTQYQDTRITLTTDSSLTITGVASVIGSDGIDKLTMTDHRTLTVRNVETVLGTDGTDTVYINGGNLAVRSIENIYGTGGSVDTIRMLSGESIAINYVESVIGSSGNDAVSIYYGSDDTSPVYITAAESVTSYYGASLALGKGVLTLQGSGYADSVTLTTSMNINLANIDTLVGSSGTDRVTLLNSSTITISNTESVIGSSGYDSVNNLSGNALWVKDVEALTAAGGGVISASGIATVTASGSHVDTLILLTASSTIVTGVESIIGSTGNDTVTLMSNGDASGNVIISGVETIVFGTAGGSLSLDGSVQSVNGSWAVETLNLLTTSAITISNIESVVGSAGNDNISANNGTGVTFVGGLGADHLSGGTGADVFVYTAAAQSSNADKDVISNFSAQGADHIKLQLGLTSFDFIANAAFTHGGHSEARFDDISKILQIDVNGDGTADMSMKLLGVNLSDLDSSDFIWS